MEEPRPRPSRGVKITLELSSAPDVGATLAEMDAAFGQRYFIVVRSVAPAKIEDPQRPGKKRDGFRVTAEVVKSA